MSAYDWLEHYSAITNLFRRTLRRKGLHGVHAEEAEQSAWVMMLHCGQAMLAREAAHTSRRGQVLTIAKYMALRAARDKWREIARHDAPRVSCEHLDDLASTEAPGASARPSQLDLDDAAVLLTSVPAHHALLVLSVLDPHRVTASLVAEADRDRRGGREFPARCPETTVEALRRVPSAEDREAAVAHALFLPADGVAPAPDTLRKLRRALANAVKVNRAVFDRQLGIA